jgi:hypothetical protein
MATFTGADKAISFLFDVVSNIADDYDNTSTYALGDYVLHEGALYKCVNPIASPEEFTPAHWEAVLVMNEIESGGGGGGGTTVVANPSGTATAVLNKLQVASTIYRIPTGESANNVYSEEEHVVGVWIDGKTVFEKTINFGAMPNRASKSVNHNIADIDYIIDVRGTAVTTAGGCFPIPFTNDQGYTSQLCMFANRTSITVRTSVDRSEYTKSYITLRYTKTVETIVYERVTETGDTRVTETGDVRETENTTGG